MPFNKTSVWFLFEIYDKKLLVKKDPYIVTTQSYMLKGRRTPKVKRRKIVADKKKYAQMIKNYFKTVLIISHMDSLKDIVDSTIDIDRVDGFARVNQ